MNLRKTKMVKKGLWTFDSSIIQPRAQYFKPGKSQRRQAGNVMGFSPFLFQLSRLEADLRSIIKLAKESTRT